MNVNLLAISIGNTRTSVGAFVRGDLQCSDQFDNNQEVEALHEQIKKVHQPLKDIEDAVVLAASVHTEAMSMKIVRIAERVSGRTAYRVEKDVSIPIGRQLDPESIVGEDRLLNAAAAYDVLKQACVVVDAGTAVTVDFVDGAGTFHGGAIVPGASLMLASLHEHTAQLPDVQLTRPHEAIGHNTAQAMVAGMYHGIRGAVRELVEQYAEVAGIYPVVVATGGDAELLFKDYPLIDRVVPQLILRGLAVTMQQAMDAEV